MIDSWCWPCDNSWRDKKQKQTNKQTKTKTTKQQKQNKTKTKQAFKPSTPMTTINHIPLVIYIFIPFFSFCKKSEVRFCQLLPGRKITWGNCNTLLIPIYHGHKRYHDIQNDQCTLLTLVVGMSLYRNCVCHMLPIHFTPGSPCLHKMVFVSRHYSDTIGGTTMKFLRVTDMDMSLDIKVLLFKILIQFDQFWVGISIFY